MKSKKYRWNIKKFVSNLIKGILLITLTWLAVSYIEIICKNLTDNPTYWNGNIITMLFGR